MGSRLKEDERNERTIRNLLKLPANKKCINCNSLGPQYVCTNFWTFVCTTCSGIHREFTHRVKSVSMAKFTSQEVAALQNGGNERAKSIYFKDWDTQRHSYPNNSNIERLRDFIRHVYVDRRFSEERSSEKPPRNTYENRSDAFRSASRSPPCEDTYDRRRNDRSSPGGRSDDSYFKYDDKSPGHDRESRYSSDQGRSPNHPEIVNDWRREDRFSDACKMEDHRTSDGDSLSDGRSPDHQQDMKMSSPPVVRPVRDILGDNIIPLKIGPPKPNSIMSGDPPAHVVRTASSSGFGSSDGNQVEPKKETLGSLIDFDADPEPLAVASSKPQIQQTNSFLTTIEPTSSTSNNNWASFDFGTEAKTPQVESTSSNTLDSLFTQLATSSLVPPQSGPFQNFSAPLLAPGGASKPDVLEGSVHMPPFNAEGFTVAPISAGVAFDSMNISGSWPGMQHHQQPHSLSSSGQNAQSIQQPSTFPAAHLQHVSKSSQEVANEFETQTRKAETKTSERSALPEDLFSAPHGWPSTHPAGMGFAMHYSVPAPTHYFQQPSKSSNPFDFGNESSPAPAFPSMAPLHGALPATPNLSQGLVHTPNVSAPFPVYMQHPTSSYTSHIPPSYAAGMPSGAYLGQQTPQSIPVVRPQGVVGFGDSTFHGSTSANQTVGGGYPPPAAPNSFSGNPFG